MAFFGRPLSGLLVIYSPDFWIFLGVEGGQIHFIAAQCFERKWSSFSLEQKSLSVMFSRNYYLEIESKY